MESRPVRSVRLTSQQARDLLIQSLQSENTDSESDSEFEFDDDGDQDYQP